MLVLAVTGGAFLAGIVTRLSTWEQGILAWGLIVFILVLRRLMGDRERYFGLVLTLLVLFLLGRYLFFRLSSTLVGTTLIELFFVFLLFCAELYGMMIQVLGLIVNIMPLYRPVEPVDLHDPDLPVVDVLIPTYNEPEQMVAITASACTLFDYPRDRLNIFLLDDGGTVQKRQDPDPEKARAARVRHETLKVLAEYLEIHYLTRERNEDAKAGNINAALYGPDDGQVRPRGDLVLILDCDHVPTRDFLKNTVGYFLRDPQLFLVQTPHFFINPDPVEKNLGTFDKMPGDNVMFYGKVMPGLDLWNGAFFCGSGALLRRRCLDRIGGVVGETITEDAETALALHGQGFNSVYLGRPMLCGLSPETFEDFIIQRNRWAQGMVQILLLKNPLLSPGLTLAQKLCYFNSAAFWFFAFSRLMFMLAPFFFLYGNIQIYHATLAQCLAYPIPYMVLSMILTNTMYGKVRHPFFSELYEVVLSFYNIPAILAVLRNPRSPRFMVTPKDTSLAHDTVSPLAWPFYLLLFLFAGMVPAAMSRVLINPQLAGAVGICLAWGAFNLIIVLLCLGVVWERRQVRKKYRIPVREPVRARKKDSPDRSWISGWSTDLSEEGMGLTLPVDPDIASGVVLELEVRNSRGQRFIFQGVVLRREMRDGKMHLGCRYIYEDEESFLAITNHLYGDSQRWQRLWDRRQKRVSIIRGLWVVLRLGIIGCYHHFKGLLWLAGKRVSTWTDRQWHRLRAGRGSVPG